MSQQLVAQLRKKREIRIPVGKFVFLAHRPTQLELRVLLSLQGEAQIRRTLDFVYDWEHVVGDDILGDASGDIVKFDRDLWQEWAPDHPEFWNAIADRLLQEFEKRDGEEADATKN